MPFARHRLDCCICLLPVEHSDIQPLSLLATEMSVAKEKGKSLPAGGFASLLLEESPRARLYANHQGGYRVFCPGCNENIAKGFSLAVEQWRRGSPREMACSFCGQIFFLEGVVSQPPLCFASAAIILHDVQEASLGAFWEARCRLLLCDFQIIFRRIG